MFRLCFYKVAWYQRLTLRCSTWLVLRNDGEKIHSCVVAVFAAIQRQGFLCEWIYQSGECEFSKTAFLRGKVHTDTWLLEKRHWVPMTDGKSLRWQKKTTVPLQKIVHTHKWFWLDSVSVYRVTRKKKPSISAEKSAHLYVIFGSDCGLVRLHSWIKAAATDSDRDA